MTRTKRFLPRARGRCRPKDDEGGWTDSTRTQTALASENIAGHRARIARWPRIGVNLLKEGGEMRIERFWLFEVDRVTGVGQDDECGRRDCALQKQTRI